jgi:ABC-type multidrug transport system fused ATPase/permease subunit
MKTKEVEFMNKYRLSADKYNIILQEKQTVTGEGKKKPTIRSIGDVYWQNVAFFSNPKNALDYIIEKEIRESWVDDLKEVVKGMDKLYKAIQDIKLEPLPQIVQ